jgi:formylmethanofuran dehydrogenase subunit E-like metal-binding protein
MDAVQKQLFISDEIFSLTLKATVTRVKFYASNAKEKHRADFRGSLRRQLEDTAKKYVTTVSEEDHIRHIVNLAKTLTKSHSTYLDGSRFRIGRAQKALNLYLVSWQNQVSTSLPLRLRDNETLEDLRRTQMDCLR